MEKGTIQKALDYYLGPRFQDEILRATREFFNRPGLGPGGQLRLEENDVPLFNEWFLFDYKMRNNKTPLEDFFERNPRNLNLVRLQVYKDLQENYYGPYEILAVRLGEGLTVKNLQTAQVFEVREYAATFGVKAGIVFFGRVAKVADHYELVSSDPIMIFDNTDKQAERIFSKMKLSWNPKAVREIITLDKAMQGTQLFQSLAEAEQALNEFLNKYGLSQFVKTENIQRWIYEDLGGSDCLDNLNILLGLIHPNHKNYRQACDELIEIYPFFCNLCPRKFLHGISSEEALAEFAAQGEKPKYHKKIQEFPPLGWDKHYQKGFRQMRRAKFEQALVESDKVFRYMIKQKTTFPEIYRFYANKAVCHFALGQEKLGKGMLDIALELNPYYDFAKAERTKYKVGFYREYKDVENESDLNSDSAHLYYQMLKEYQINFAQKLKTPSPIFLIGN